MEYLNSNNKESTETVDEDDKQRKLRFRKKVLDEIISSEKAYIDQLNLLLNEFVRPVKEKNLLPKNSFSAIFGDIETLHSLNVTLYSELVKEDDVGHPFLKIAPYLKLYSTYANDYEVAVNSLQDLRKTNKEFESFISQQERLPTVSRKLEALLIVPIQRVPRYCLLLSELISYTDPIEEDELFVLNAALKQIVSVAHHINEQIREQENMQRMIRIQRALSNGKPRIVMPGRRFIKEGTLKKISADGESAHQRHFILFSDMLLYCKLRCGYSDTTQKGSLTCCCVLPLRHCRVEAVMGDGLFKVICRDEELLVCSSSAEEGKRWVETINIAIVQLETNLRTLRKESSSRRPMRKRQLKQCDSNSLMRKFQAKRVAIAAANFDVDFLRSPHSSTTSSPLKQPTSTPHCGVTYSPCSIKLPKWPSPCPGTPSFPYSPRKLFLASKTNSPTQQDIPLFCSPPIQIDSG